MRLKVTARLRAMVLLKVMVILALPRGLLLVVVNMARSQVAVAAKCPSVLKRFPTRRCNRDSSTATCASRYRKTRLTYDANTIIAVRLPPKTSPRPEKTMPMF